MAFNMKGFSGPLKQNKKGELSNYEIYKYYKNKEHITGADEEMKARKEATMPVDMKPVTGTAPLPGFRNPKKIFAAFNKVAKHAKKMNKQMEADLIKKGYTFVKKKKK